MFRMLQFVSQAVFSINSSFRSVLAACQLADYVVSRSLSVASLQATTHHATLALLADVTLK